MDMQAMMVITDICHQYKECLDGCPFYTRKCCFMDAPTAWELDKIEEVLKDVTTP